MEREIKKGVTIIHAGCKCTTALNKNGYKGISRFGDRFRVDIAFGHRPNEKKYLIGIFDTIQEASKARRIAELKALQGCFDEWISNRPSGHLKQAYKEYWKREFERMDEHENNKRNH